MSYFVAGTIDPVLSTIECFQKATPGDGIEYGCTAFSKTIKGRSSVSIDFKDMIHLLAGIYLKNEIEYEIVEEEQDLGRYFLRGWYIKHEH